MTTAPTTQREMHAVLARCHAPTLPLAAFAAHCGEAAAAVREWCELDRLYVGANKIDFAWDIGTGRHRDEVRIPSYYLVPEHRLQVLPEARILGLLFRGCAHISAATNEADRQVSGVQFQRALSCSTNLVMDLVAAGELALYTERRHRRGAGSSPALTWASVRTFLQRRKL
jgi:hypothetical protein